MNKNSKIYIAGHRGMVGKTLYNLLKNNGYKNLLTRTSNQLDLTKQKAVENFFKIENPEYIFLCAAKVGGIMANMNDLSGFLYNNIMIAMNIIHSAYKYKTKKLLNLGSSCIYPRNCHQPMQEKHLLTSSFEPTNEGYAIAKVAALKLCEYYNKEHSTNFISLMPCNLYGVNEKFDTYNSHVLAALIMKFHQAKTKNKKSITLWGTGKPKREFLYVEDLAKACIHFMKNVSAKNMDNVFVNIGAGQEISIKELAEIIKNTVQFKGKIKWDHSKPDGMS
ncbi:GDP-L-fucose synthase family protein, partial [Patescibacteria group bacterium]